MEDYSQRLNQALIQGSTGAIHSVTEWMLEPLNHNLIIPALFMLQERGCPSSSSTSSSSLSSSSSSIFQTSLYALYIGNDIYFTAMGRRNTPLSSTLRDHITYILSLLPLTLDILLTMSMRQAQNSEDQAKVQSIHELWYRHQVLQPVTVTPSFPSSAAGTITSLSSSLISSFPPILPSSSSSSSFSVQPLPSSSSTVLPSTSFTVPSSTTTLLSSIPSVSPSITTTSTVDITTLPVGYMVSLYQKYRQKQQQQQPHSTTSSSSSSSVVVSNSKETMLSPYTPLPENTITLPRPDINIEQGRLEARILDYVKLVHPSYSSKTKSFVLQPKTFSRKRNRVQKRTDNDDDAHTTNERSKFPKYNRESYLRHAFDRYQSDTNTANLNTLNEQQHADKNDNSNNGNNLTQEYNSRSYKDRETESSEFRGLGFG